ncbi:MAG: protein kinase domain-containing protein [Hyphomicrobium sp.]
MFQDKLTDFIKEHLYDVLVPLLMKNMQLVASSSEEEQVELLYECINRTLYNSENSHQEDGEPKPRKKRDEDGEPKPRKKRDEDGEPKPKKKRDKDGEPKPRKKRDESNSEPKPRKKRGESNSEESSPKIKRKEKRKEKCGDEETETTETANHKSTRQHALLQDIIRNKYSKLTVAKLKEILKTKEYVGVSFNKLKKHDLIELLVVIESKSNNEKQPEQSRESRESREQSRESRQQSRESRESRQQSRESRQQSRQQSREQSCESRQQSCESRQQSRQQSRQHSEPEKPKGKTSKKSRHNFEGTEFRQKHKGTSFKIGALVDSGGMGDVYMCHRESQPETYAIKIEQDGLTLLYEANILSKLAGSEENHIIPILARGWIDKTNCDSIPDGHRYYYMITPLMDISLKNLNYQNKPDKVQKVAQQILIALEYLHSRGYSHNDVKPENIMRKDKVFYLIDFGMCTKINKTSKSVGGTPRYQPLDSYDKMQNFTRVNDIESLLYTMADVYDTLPWTDDDDAKTTKTMKKQWFESSSRNIPQVFESLVFEINNATTLTYQLG